MRRVNVIFELTMPNRGSWNGKWTGDGGKYTVKRKIDLDNPCIGKSFWYQWNDGWGANVGVRTAGKEKPSNDFRGYDWMIDSIIEHGKIQI
jgi:hypothetical protein